jgi:hypothetical protein
MSKYIYDIWLNSSYIMFQTEVADQMKTNILCSITLPPPRENSAIYKTMWKNMSETGHKWNYNMAHAIWMLG